VIQDLEALRTELFVAAKRAASRAYAPYSNFFVGAAAMTTTGVFVSGCNVENASYGLTLCAECGLVSDLIVSHAGAITHVVVCSPAGELISPCGRCRQLLLEHAAPGAMFATTDGWDAIANLLPGDFSAEDLR
jgi:cytidine deaminase